jgi:heme exporter protein A
VHSPSVLLLDEPSSGLDRASLARFEDVVVERRDAGAVVVVVSHRDEWVKRLSGQTITLERGRISRSG